MGSRPRASSISVRESQPGEVSVVSVMLSFLPHRPQGPLGSRRAGADTPGNGGGRAGCDWSPLPCGAVSAAEDPSGGRGPGRVRGIRPTGHSGGNERGQGFMTQEVRGVVSRTKEAPVEIETVIIPDPGPGEAVVRVQACGVCHTDLHYREGGINDEFPFLLGHEAAGVVESVGAGVEEVAPGDYVILNWRAVCGQCRACLRGRPWYCFDTHNAAQPMTLTDGTALSPALGIGAFAEKTLVAAGQCTKVDPQDRKSVV